LVPKQHRHIEVATNSGDLSMTLKTFSQFESKLPANIIVRRSEPSNKEMLMNDKALAYQAHLKGHTTTAIASVYNQVIAQ
jgi:hypothetical protein